MKRFYVIAIASLLSCTAIFAQSFTVTANVDESGNAVFSIKKGTSSASATLSGCGFIQLSKFNDFRSTDYIKRFTNNGTSITNSAKEFLTIESSEIENGEYYWRVFYLKSDNNNKVPYFNSKTITFGSKETASTQSAEDNTVYDDVKLNDNIELSLEPVWLRSNISGAPLTANYYINPTATYPNLLKTETASFVPYTNGMVVRNNIIYTPCGAANPINWNFEKTQLELNRYNLLTGEPLETTVIVSSEGVFDGQSAMSLLGEDANGTIYFTTCQFESDNLSRVYLYTITLPDDSESDNPTLTATLQADFSMGNTDLSTKNSYIFVVEGSIADKNYTLWGSSSSDKSSSGNNLNDVVYRWVVDGKNTEFEYAFITEADITSTEKSYANGLSRITPLGNNNIYYHSIRKDDNDCSIVPGLYSFDAENHTCKRISSANEIANTDFTQNEISVLGICHSYFETRPIVAFGQTSDNSSHIAISELTDADGMSFKDANLLWTLNQDGFSTNMQQGCDLKIIDLMATFADEAPSPSEDTPSSKLLLAYLPNGGMGLYNLTAVNTTGIDDVAADATQQFVLQGRTLFTTANTQCTLTDIAGRQFVYTPSDSCIDLNALSAGLYILQLEGQTQAHKIVLR